MKSSKFAAAKRRPASNRELVFAALRKERKPLTAYQLLERLRSQGISAPPTVYRALEQLIADGLAHRLESLNAFVACAHPHHTSAAMFSICDDCGDADEISDAPVNRRISDWALNADFELNHSILEIHGRCSACARAETG